MSLNLRNSGNPLTQPQLDSNFTFLNNRDITGATVSGNILYLNKQDGTNYSVNLPSSTGGTSSSVFTGNTSASCINDLYISNLHGCSPITVHDSIQSIGSISTGLTSFAFGESVITSGNYSHAQGGSYVDKFAVTNYTTSEGLGSHAEGGGTISTGNYSHTEGILTRTKSLGSHAEGFESQALGNYSHAEGASSFAGVYGYSAITSTGGVITLDSAYSDVSLQFTTSNYILAYGPAVAPYYDGLSYQTISNVSWDGTYTIITVVDSNFSGATIISPIEYPQASGADKIMGGEGSHAEGSGNIAFGTGSNVKGSNNRAVGAFSNAEGENTKALGYISHVQGTLTETIGNYSFASGYGSKSIGDSSFIHSTNSVVVGDRSVVLGGQNITGYTSDTVYVPNLIIDTIPTNDDTATQVLIRDSVTGTIGYREASTLGGFTGNTDGNCISDFYVYNIRECTANAKVNIVSNISAGSADQEVSNTSFAFGSSNTVSGTECIALGNSNIVTTGNNSIALGRGNTVNDNYSIAIGESNDVTQPHSFATGYDNQVNAQYGMSTGYKSKVYTFGEYARSSAGDYGQYGTVTYFNEITTNAITDLYLDVPNGVTAFYLEDGFAYKFNLYGTAFSTDGKAAAYESQALGIVSGLSINFIGFDDGTTFSPLSGRSDNYFLNSKLQISGNNNQGLTASFTLVDTFVSNIYVILKMDYLRITNNVP